MYTPLPHSFFTLSFPPSLPPSLPPLRAGLQVLDPLQELLLISPSKGTNKLALPVEVKGGDGPDVAFACRLFVGVHLMRRGEKGGREGGMRQLNAELQ